MSKPIDAPHGAPPFLHRDRSIAELVVQACLLEASSPKLGNVHPHASFADLSYQDFVISAHAIEPVFRNIDHFRVGQLILESVIATRKVVHTNTNLGILLLLGPLAKAARSCETNPEGNFEASLQNVLDQLNDDDARNVFEAIRLVNPGGLGKQQEMDVREIPSVSLLQAMDAARHRDQIAAEYVEQFRRSKQIAIQLSEDRKAGCDWLESICSVQLQWLATEPDSLIARKNSPTVAEHVMLRARQVLSEQHQSTSGQKCLAELDHFLRSDGNRLNPGTTADLMAAGVFLVLFEQRFQVP